MWLFRLSLLEYGLWVNVSSANELSYKPKDDQSVPVNLELDCLEDFVFTVYKKN